MKKIVILSSLAFTTLCNYAQQFGGSTTQTGAIFRAGSVGVGVTAVPTGLDFVVNNATNKSGKFVLGSSALFGAYTASQTVIQGYNQNGRSSILSLVSASSSTNSLSMDFDADLLGTYSGIILKATVPANRKPFVINMYGTRAIYINPNGQVGIGTGTTTAFGSLKLAVEGIIGAREVKVTLANPWPDYVFSTNYERKSFEELSAFLSKEQHLPYIPSAKAIEAEGTQSLGETQQNIVRSLEELYLYVLDLKKENTELKKEIEALKKH